MPRVRADSKSELNEFDRLVGRRIRARRLQARKSQEELGTYCGITFQQVQKYENGKNRVSASRLQQIARCLDVAPSYFLGEAKSNGATDMESVSVMTDAMATKEGQQMLIAFSKIKKKEVRIALKDLAVALS